MVFNLVSFEVHDQVHIGVYREVYNQGYLQKTVQLKQNLWNK